MRAVRRSAALLATLVCVAVLGGAAQSLAAVPPHGSFVQAPGDPTVYYIENGVRRGVSELSLFALGGSWSRVQSISAAELAAIPRGDDIRAMFADGTFVQGPDPTVWRIEGGKRRGVTAAEFAAYGSPWAAVVHITAPALDQIALAGSAPPSAPSVPPNGSFVQAPGDPTVYYIENGRKRGVVGELSLFALGGSWSRVRSISAAELAAIPRGDDIWAMFPDGTFVQGPDPTVWRIEGGKRRGVTAAAFAAFGSPWGTVVHITAPALNAIPLGPDITGGDGGAGGGTDSRTDRFGYPLSLWRQAGFGFGSSWLKDSACERKVRKKHTGIDLAASVNQAVLATADGVVHGLISWEIGWGQAVLVEHVVPGLGRVFTQYGHVTARPGYANGRRVRRGEQIASVFNMGSNTHLHFSVWLGGYSPVSWRGALPPRACKNDPAWPAQFVDPGSFLAER